MIIHGICVWHFWRVFGWSDFKILWVSYFLHFVNSVSWIQCFGVVMKQRFAEFTNVNIVSWKLTCELSEGLRCFPRWDSQTTIVNNWICGGSKHDRFLFVDPLRWNKCSAKGGGGILPELIRQEAFIVKNSICWKLQKLILHIRCNPYFGANLLISKGRVAFGSLYRPEACVRKNLLGDFNGQNSQVILSIHLLYFLYMIVKRCRCAGGFANEHGIEFTMVLI